MERRERKARVETWERRARVEHHTQGENKNAANQRNPPRSRAGLPAKPVGPAARIIAAMMNPMTTGCRMLAYRPYEGW